MSTKNNYQNTNGNDECKYPIIRDIIPTSGDANDANVTAFENACIIAVKSATKYLLLQMKQDGSASQFNKIYGLYSGVRQAHIDDNDVLDLLSVAKLSYYETYINDSNGTLDNRDYYRNATRAIHRAIYASGRAIPTENVPPKAPRTSKPLSKSQLANANAIITAISAHLTPRQKEIFTLLASGNTQAEIVTILNIHKSNVSRHVTAIRKIALSLYPDGIRI